MVKLLNFYNMNNNTYIGMVDTVWGSDGEVHISQGDKTVTFDATDFFSWLDAVVSTTIKQRNEMSDLILINIRERIKNELSEN